MPFCTCAASSSSLRRYPSSSRSGYSSRATASDARARSTVAFAERADPVDDVDGACAVLPDAQALAAALQPILSERFDALLDGPGTGELRPALADLHDSLPLISVEDRPTGPVVSVDYDALS